MEKNNKKKIVLIIVIVLIIITALVAISRYLVFMNNEKVSNGLNIENNVEGKIENIQRPVSAEISNNETNELANNNKAEKKETEQTKNKEETEQSKNKTEKKEKEQTKNKTEKKETSKQTQTTSKKENTTTTNNSNKTNTTNSVKNEKPTLTGTTDEKKLIDSYTKYGVEVKTYTYTIYNVYSDGSKEVKSQTTTTGYERTNYKATTSELLAEARTARSKYSGMISQILNNVNIYRQEANTDNINEVTNRIPLTLDEQLCVAANVRAVEMAYSKKYSHTRPNGSSCITVLDEMGIKYMTAGENIATGQTSAASVSKSWKKSPGHYENMISENFSKIGVGVYKLDDAYYWVQLFTN